MNKTIRLVYAGYDFFAPCLHWLSNCTSVSLVACLTGTVGEPTESVRTIADRARLPVFTGPPTPSIVDEMNRLDADVLISAAYSYRLPVDDIDVKHALNLHSSLLPEGRGPSPLPYVMDGRLRAGVTLHEMVRDFDAGPVVSQESIDIDSGDEFDELALKCAAAGVRLVAELMSSYPDISSTPQSGGSYWPLIESGERMVDARVADVAEVLRAKRRFGAGGIVVQVSDSLLLGSRTIVATQCDHPFGAAEIVARSRGSLFLALADGLLELRQAEPIGI